MGIKGLLPVITPICDRKGLRHFAGQRIGVDMSCWLHKAAFSCALELALGEPTRRYVDYCLLRVKMLLHAGAVPILVFDGAPLPMKARTNASRRETRDQALARGHAALARGDRAAAFDHFSKGCKVTHEMSRAVIKEIRKLNVEYVVAPYEADAQLAFLSNAGDIDIIFTEDSDLVVYGGNKILFKMNKDGDGDLFLAKNLMALDKPNMRNFTPSMLTTVCVLSGCDFLPEGVPGLGILKAHALVKRFRTNQRVVRNVTHEKKYRVPADFTDNFYRSCLVFAHQTVYDKATGKNIHLKALDAAARAGIPETIFRQSPELPEDLSFIGPCHDDLIATGIAGASIHPVTLEPYTDSLDVVERPLSSSRRPPAAVTGMTRFLSSMQGKAAAASEGEAIKTGGMTVSAARGGASRPQSAHRSQLGRVLPSKNHFFDCRKRPATPVGHSSAVAKGFKPPKRTGSAESDPAAPEPGPASGWVASLSNLDPGGIAGKRSAGHHAARNGKRQRTMVEMNQGQPSSAKRLHRLANRFADPTKKSGVIASTMPSKKTAALVGMGKPAVKKVAPVEDDSGANCPSSPDSDAYASFAQVDSDASPAAETPIAKRPSAKSGARRERFAVPSPILEASRNARGSEMPLSGSAEELESPVSDAPRCSQVPPAEDRPEVVSNARRQTLSALDQFRQPRPRPRPKTTATPKLRRSGARSKVVSRTDIKKSKQ